MDPTGDGAQQLVAGAVAEAVVDPLEVVEVDEQHRHLGAPPAQRVLETVEEQRAVGQPGEGVAERLVLEPSLQRGEVIDRRLQPATLQRHGGMARQRGQQLQVITVKFSRAGEPVSDQHGADDATLTAQRREHCVAQSALFEVVGDRPLPGQGERSLDDHVVGGDEVDLGVEVAGIGDQALVRVDQDSVEELDEGVVDVFAHPR